MRRFFWLFLLLLLPFTAQAQTVPAQGTEATLDVATWNIEWFGSPSNGPGNEAVQFRNVLAVMRQADIDLWALQEITSPTDFQRLLDSLGTGWDGRLADPPQFGDQRIAFVWNTEVITRLSANHILTSNAYEFGYRPPLRLNARVAINGVTRNMTFITLHAKANSGGNNVENRQRREEAAFALKSYVDALLPTTPVVVLGDFNDELGRSITSGYETPYKNFLDDPDHWTFLTATLDANNRATYCGNSSSCTSGSTLDHILVTDEVVPLHDTTDRYIELTSAVSGYVSNTSDHLPVYSRFNLPAGTPNEPETALPTQATLHAPYPNPFADQTQIVYELPQAGPVTLAVYDALGRRVQVLETGVLPAGRHTATFEARTLPAGLYLVRLRAGGTSTVRRVVIVR